MPFFKNLFSNKKKHSPVEEDLIDLYVCPACWGWQEYQDEFQEKTKDLTLDKTYRKAFIQEFVEKNVTGIKLKSKDGVTFCPNCKSEFKVNHR